MSKKLPKCTDCQLFAAGNLSSIDIFDLIDLFECFPDWLLMVFCLACSLEEIELQEEDSKRGG